MFYLTTHSTHFIYGYMASDIWLRTILIVRKETRYRHIGYSYRLAARVLLYAPSHRQDSTYHGLCYTSRGALAGTRYEFLNATNYMYVYTVCYHFPCKITGLTILYIVTRLLFSNFWGYVWWISEICNYLLSNLYRYWSTFLGWRWAAFICPFGGVFVRHVLVFINWYMLMLVNKIHVHSYNVLK